MTDQLNPLALLNEVDTFIANLNDPSCLSIDLLVDARALAEQTADVVSALVEERDALIANLRAIRKTWATYHPDEFEQMNDAVMAYVIPGDM